MSFQRIVVIAWICLLPVLLSSVNADLQKGCTVEWAVEEGAHASEAGVHMQNISKLEDCQEYCISLPACLALDFFVGTDPNFGDCTMEIMGELRNKTLTIFTSLDECQNFCSSLKICRTINFTVPFTDRNQCWIYTSQDDLDELYDAETGQNVNHYQILRSACKEAPSVPPTTKPCLLDCAETGYQVDMFGEEICECKPLSVTTPLPSRAACPLVACTERCPRGFVVDSRGCETCDCIQPNPDCVPAVRCTMYCEHGHTLDQSGCATCQCAAPPICSDVTCMMKCSQFRKDQNGCQLCECDSPPVCPEVDCSVRCPKGFLLDLDGCQTCDCIKQSSECSQAKQCLIYCEHGYKLDQKGCATCQCAEGPVCSDIMCELKGCPGGYKKDENGCRLCQCADAPVCSDAICRMACPGGFKKDNNGCQICECSETPVCSDAVCEMACYEGFKKDENGCQICQCADAPVCSDAMCKMACPGGFKKDNNGCQICECSDAPVCSDAVCRMACPGGLKKDENGCQICSCADVPVCSDIMCLMHCPGGYKKDDNGCQLCQCADTPVCGDAMCRMACPGGFKKDDNGCWLCECAEVVTCEDISCSHEEVCIDEDKDGYKTARCVPGRTWCSTPKCPTLICEEGLRTDANGCEVCECRTEPRVPCSEDLSLYRMTCWFGSAYDTNGCLTGDCLPYRHGNVSCPLDGQVLGVRMQCKGGPYYSTCVDSAEIGGEYVTLNYLAIVSGVPPGFGENTDEFGERVAESIGQQISTDPQYVIIINVSRLDSLSVRVTFLLKPTPMSSPDQVVQSFNTLKAALYFSDRSSVSFYGVTFFPDTASLSVVHFMKRLDAPPPESVDGLLDPVFPEWSERNMSPWILGLIVLGGAVVVVVTACVAVIACKKLCKKCNNKYTALKEISSISGNEELLSSDDIAFIRKPIPENFRV